MSATRVADESDETVTPGLVVVLNGVPRSGKTTLAAEIVDTFDGTWLNLGVDARIAATPGGQWPGIGLRPGGERPDLEPVVLSSYAQLFDDIAEHTRRGFHVVADVGIHDDYSQPLDILGEMHRRLQSCEVLFVGVHCPLAVLRERRQSTGYLTWDEGERPPAPVLRWQHAVHEGKVYDIEVDTSRSSPADCAAVVRSSLADRM